MAASCMHVWGRSRPPPFLRASVPGPVLKKAGKGGVWLIPSHLCLWQGADSDDEPGHGTAGSHSSEELEGSRGEHSTGEPVEAEAGATGGGGKRAELDTWTLRGMRAAAAAGGATAAPALTGTRATAGGNTGTEDVAGMHDQWAEHMGYELSTEELERLALRSSTPPPKPADAPKGCELQRLAAAEGMRWQLGGGRSYPPAAPASLAAAGVKERLRARWADAGAGEPDAGARPGITDGMAAPSTSGRRAGNGGSGAGARGEFASASQRAFFGALASYADVMATCRGYPAAPADAPPGSELRARDEFMDAYLLHALNHVAKTADRIKKVRCRLRTPGMRRAARGGGA
eukprot:366358-Chlamydomonas_euryale.AAC.3